MPFKSDNIPINNEQLDRRAKLTVEQKEEIKALYETGGYSLRKLGTMYKVDKRTIQFIVSPEKLERAKQQYKERRKDGRYYNKDTHKEAIKAHRKYKHELYKSGEIGKE